MSLADRVGQGVRATLRDVESGEEAVVSAKHLIDARGYFFKGHRRREEDLNFHSSDVQETQVAEVSAKLAEAKVDNGASSPRLYVLLRASCESRSHDLDSFEMRFLVWGAESNKHDCGVSGTLLLVVARLGWTQSSTSAAKCGKVWMR